MFVVGLFVPTSSNATPIANDFIVIAGAALFVGAFVAINGLAINRAIMSAVGLVLLWLATVVGQWQYPGSPLLLGSAVSVAVFFVTTAVKIQVQHGLSTLWKLFDVVSIVMILVAAATIVGEVHVIRLLVLNYSAFYDALTANMLMQGKPVFTFATHSVAGFFYYLFFLVHWSRLRVKSDLPRIAFASSFILMLALTRSTTSVALMLVALMQLFGSLAKRRLAIGVAASLLAVAFLGMNQQLYLIGAIFGSKKNGIAGRYGEQGALSLNIAYLRDHFLPVGVVDLGTRFVYMDSGVLIALVRGGVPFAVIFYGAFWLFVKSSLPDRRIALTLWLVVVGFELAFPITAYFRALYLLPIVVLLLSDSGRPVVNTEQEV